MRGRGTGRLGRRWRRVLVAACAGCVVVSLGDAVAVAAGGTDLYAAPSGGGTSCTSGSPCSLTQALSAAQDGDTVILTAGTYTPPPTSLGSGFSSAAAITVEGETGFMPTIDGLYTLGRSSTPSEYGLHLTKPGATVRNLKVDDAFYDIAVADDSTVTDVQVAGAAVFGNSVSVGVKAGSGASITDSTFGGVAAGVSAGDDSTVTDVQVMGAAGSGVSTGKDGSVSDVQVTGTPSGIPPFEFTATTGVSAGGGSSITDSTVTDCAIGVSLVPATGETVTATGLDVSRNSTGLAETGAGAAVVGESSIHDNTSYGISVQSGSLLVENGSTLTGNPVALMALAGPITLDGVAVSGSNGTVPAPGGGSLAYPAAVVVGGGPLTVRDGSSITDNTVGGILAGAIPLTVQDSTISGNAASGGTGMVGGIAAGGSATIQDSTITDNTASSTGAAVGGIWAQQGSLTVQRSTISDNTATANNEGGIAVGGVFETGSVTDSTVTDSTVAGNAASAPDEAGAAGGGVFAVNSGVGPVERSTIAGNTAAGSAISIGAVGSFATPGDGSGNGVVEQSTLVGNTSTGGSKISAAVSSVRLSATIVARSHGADCASVTDAGYNIDDDGTCGFSSAQHSVGDSAAIDDYLGQLADNGGPTETVALLRTPSPATASPDPAVDAIPPSFVLPSSGVLACSTPDQRGVLPPSGSDCAIGAYERFSAPKITWPTPAPIRYGAPLTSTQLDATANVAGTFVYSPPAGTVLSPGTHTLSVTFTPADTADYPTVSKSVQLIVVQPPTFTSADHATFVALRDNSFQVTTTGGYPTGPITFTTTGPLPSGVTLSSSGLLSGTPAVSASGYWHFTINASNGLASANQAFTLTVRAPVVKAPNKAPVGDGLIQGVQLLTVPGSTLQWAASGFAPGAPVTLAFYNAQSYGNPVTVGVYYADASGNVRLTGPAPNGSGIQYVLAAGYAPNGTIRYLTGQTRLMAP